MGKERLESIVIATIGFGFAGFLAISGVNMVGHNYCSEISLAEQNRNNPAYEYCLREDTLKGTAGYAEIAIGAVISTGTVLYLANKK